MLDSNEISSFPLNQFWLNFKSVFLSLYFHILLSKNNFNKIKHLHNLIEEKTKFEYTNDQRIEINQIAKAIKFVEKKTPWKPNCYNLALLARKLLSKNNISSSLKIGFRKRNNQMEGHAWVSCNEMIISGYLPDLHSYKTLKPIKNR